MRFLAHILISIKAAASMHLLLALLRPARS